MPYGSEEPSKEMDVILDAIKENFASIDRRALHRSRIRAHTRALLDDIELTLASQNIYNRNVD